MAVISIEYDEGNKKNLGYKSVEISYGEDLKEKKNFKTPKKWHNNLVNSYMVGIDLLWIKAWFTVSKGTMKIDIDEK